MKTRPKATSTPRIEDDRVAAMEWTIPPGAETGWHKHGRDYVVVYLTSGNLLSGNNKWRSDGPASKRASNFA
jgi:quercetin dioxygenase-like cupin family protein